MSETELRTKIDNQYEAMSNKIDGVKNDINSLGIAMYKKIDEYIEKQHERDLAQMKHCTRQSTITESNEERITQLEDKCDVHFKEHTNELKSKNKWYNQQLTKAIYTVVIPLVMSAGGIIVGNYLGAKNDVQHTNGQTLVKGSNDSPIGSRKP